jgi:hypothetical protein
MGIIMDILIHTIIRIIIIIITQKNTIAIIMIEVQEEVGVQQGLRTEEQLLLQTTTIELPPIQTQ